MTKPTKEQIDKATPEQLAEWVAVHCMGWLDNDAYWMIPHQIDEDGNVDFEGYPKEDWQPHLPTEKGIVQAISLAEKYDLVISFCKMSGGNFLVTCPLIDPIREVDLSWQTAVLRACLYSIIGE